MTFLDLSKGSKLAPLAPPPPLSPPPEAWELWKTQKFFKSVVLGILDSLTSSVPSSQNCRDKQWTCLFFILPTRLLNKLPSTIIFLSSKNLTHGVVGQNLIIYVGALSWKFLAWLKNSSYFYFSPSPWNDGNFIINHHGSVSQCWGPLT